QRFGGAVLRGGTGGRDRGAGGRRGHTRSCVLGAVGAPLTEDRRAAGSLPGHRTEHRTEEASVGVVTLSTEIPGPRSREILDRKERVVCDPLDIHIPAVIDTALGATV